MQNFIDNLSSLSWWLSVVVVGILVNMLSTYLKPHIDLRWSNLYSGWQTRKARKGISRIDRERVVIRQVTALRENPHRQVLLAIRVLDLKFKLILLIILLMLMLIILYLLGETPHLLIFIPLVTAISAVAVWALLCLEELVNKTLLFDKTTNALYDITIEKYKHERMLEELKREIDKSGEA